MHLRVTVTALALLLAAVSGCASDSKGRVGAPPLTSGDGLNDQTAPVIRGRLFYEGGCVLLGARPVVWPDSVTWDSNRKTLRLPSGDDSGYGAWLTGRGRYLSAAAVRDAFGDDVADAAEDCLGSTGDVAVFESGSEIALGWCTASVAGWQCMYPP